MCSGRHYLKEKSQWFLVTKLTGNFEPPSEVFKVMMNNQMVIRFEKKSGRRRI